MALYTYPGVYVQELPSGVRAISGVATSVAAFAGWAARGPESEAGLVLSWSDYERQYGGLDADSLMSYAVYHFFNNGGRQAYIVRLVYTDDVVGKIKSTPLPQVAKTATNTTTDGSKLTISANSSGAWGNQYAVTFKPIDATSPRFRMTVVLAADPTKTVESFENLSMLSSDPRSVASVVNDGSQLVTVVLGGSTKAPTATDPIPLVGGYDGTKPAPNYDAANLLLPALEQLDRVDLFNLLCVPGEARPDTVSSLEQFCRARRAFLIVDSQDPDYVQPVSTGTGGDSTEPPPIGPKKYEDFLGDDSPLKGIVGDDAINAALYFPWVMAPDPLQGNRPRAFPPCGFVAGLYAKTDKNRGVWKAPAGIEASLTGVTGLVERLTDAQNGVLNPQAVNCLRTFPVYSTIVWGARTLRGNDEVGSEWKYVSVRRLALFLEESLFRGTQWVVFEPNDEHLWSQIRLNVGSFLQSLFRQGAFQGTSARDAYFVKCDGETTTQSDIDLGVVNIIVGFAPVKPAEFVVLKFQQMAGQPLA